MAVGSSNDFDVVVLGAGTGGYTAAFRAGQLGLKVALVAEDKIGGPASTAAASRPRPCSSRPAFADKVRHAKDYGHDPPGEPGSTTRRWLPAGTPSSSGCGPGSRRS